MVMSEYVERPSVISSIDINFRRSLEVAGSSDAWDETNITCYYFRRLQASAQNLLIFLKQKKIRICRESVTVVRSIFCIICTISGMIKFIGFDLK